MKNFIRILCFSLGIFFLLSQNLLAQNEESATVSKKYFLGGTLSLQNLETENDLQSSFFAQTQNGTVLITGESTSDFGISVSPCVGFQLNHRASLGLSTLFSRGRNTITDAGPNSSNYTINNTELGVGVFYRFDIEINSRLLFFIQPSVNYTKEISTTNLDGEKNPNFNTDILSASVSFGAKLKLNDKWNFISSVSAGGYSYQSHETENGLLNELKVSNHVINFDIVLSSIAIGIERSF